MSDLKEDTTPSAYCLTASIIGRRAAVKPPLATATARDHRTESASA
ncbi:hypothetical protein I6H42_00060 [Schaalia meyeri]|uniref:Uncharacterized protein n=1 Tax=Schaalia meyeri TaxID=52773 RepID=A0AAP9Y8I8_9ACTO|nr:hypothetical protein [Schaalia meyeri]QQC43880.1 hypothetical protein I6H42_00060 [Schaalia meyeri]